MAQLGLVDRSLAGATRLAQPATRWQTASGRWRSVRFVDEVLRGVAQVMLQDNPLTGLLFLAGVAAASWPLALAGLAGVVVSTLTAYGLGVDRALVGAGLFGFNGFLTGVGLAFFLQPSGAVAAYLVVAAAASTVVMAALSRVLAVWSVPALTAPFVLVVWVFLLGAYQFELLTAGEHLAPGLPEADGSTATALGAGVADTAGLTVANLAGSLLRGVGQVMLQNSALTGALFLVGLVVNSRVSAGFAVLGSAAGLGAGLALGADGGALFQGLYGFNSVLCAIALGGVFAVLSWRTAVYALAGALLGAVASAGLMAFLAPLGIPALTGPFVVVTWLLLWPVAELGAVDAVGLDEVDTPEVTRRRRLAHSPARHSPEAGSQLPT